MKIYKCDKCGREVVEPYGWDIFDDEGWTTVWYDEQGIPIWWDYDEKTDSYYTHQQIITVKHFCPTCY